MELITEEQSYTLSSLCLIYLSGASLWAWKIIVFLDANF